MNLGKNLRALRKFHKLTQSDLANAIGYNTFSTVQKWEDGTTYPRLDTLMKLTAYFGVNIDTLISGNVEYLFNNSKAIPIVGIVKGGYGYYPRQELYGHEYVKEDEAKGAEYFYLKVVGDSMIDARIMPGDIAYIRSQNTIESNQIAVVLTSDDEVTLKEVVLTSKGMYLKAKNKKYQDVFYSNEEIIENNIRILGKLIHVKINF